MWGICGDIQSGRDMIDKFFLKTPTKIRFSDGNQQRRRSNVNLQQDDDSNIAIVDIKLGENFSVALSNKGIVYTWGQNEKGQLGLGHETLTADPTPVVSLVKPIQKIDCGLKHVLALTKDYQLYGWGSNA